jgi:Skp family chaperone for outer membrane proteins
MKTAKTITLAITLFIAQVLFAQCSPEQSESNTQNTVPAEPSYVVADSTQTVRVITIAYVEYDSLLSQYKLAQDVQKELVRKEMSINNTMESERKKLQEEAAEFERNMQNGIYITEERAKIEYEKILKKEQEAMKRGQKLVEDLEKKREELIADGFVPTPMITPAPNVKFFFVTDPAGVKIQFM